MTERCIPGVVYRLAGMRAIKRRDQLGVLLNEKGFETGAEVGVQQGYNAEKILYFWKNCQSFLLIDLWSHQDNNYRDFANNQDHQTFYEDAMFKMQPWRNITSVYRMKSIEAAQKIPDYSLDFVYIDARHDYCAVSEDIESYWPKLRPGGIMSGHDYLTQDEMPDPQDWSVCESGVQEPRAVRGAVDDFALKYGLTVTVTYNDPAHRAYQTWLVQKPTNPNCIHQGL